MEMNNAEDFACQLVRFIASPLIYDCFFSICYICTLTIADGTSEKKYLPCITIFILFFLFLLGEKVAAGGNLFSTRFRDFPSRVRQLHSN